MGAKLDRTPKDRKSGTREVLFVCNIKPDAKDVFVAGDFNGWDATRDRLVRQSGRFSRRMKLSPGEHQYRFVIDGQWHSDPKAGAEVPNEFGASNSVIRV